MKKAVLCILLCSIIGVAGCSAHTPSEEIANSTRAFSAEEIKANQVGVTAAERNIVYQYVSNSVKIDKDKLVSIEDSDAKLIKEAVTTVNETLRTCDNEKLVQLAEDALKKDVNDTENKTDTDDKKKDEDDKAEVAEVLQTEDRVIISESIANYMLHQFAKTPYTWKMSDCKMVGMDAATHLYFVDVYYETTNEKKEVLPETLLPKGTPNYSTLVEERFEDYMEAMGAIGTDKESATKSKFNSKWGSINEIVKGQSFKSPVLYTNSLKKKPKNIGAFTYRGTTNSYDVKGAKMVFRFAMGYDYNVNNNVIIEPKSVYMYSYSVDNADDIKKSVSQDNIDGEEVLGVLINRLIYRYEKAMDECDNEGLYGMYKSYEKYDTEINMYDQVAYHKLGTYLYDIIGRKGEKVYVEVTFNNKERTKGSAMSDATYKDSMLFTIKVNDDDSLTLIDVCTLNRTLVGEPLSVIKGVAGVSEQMQFSEDTFTKINEEAITDTLKNFMQLELTQDFSSNAFSTCIDLGISSSELENIKSTIQSVNASEVITWITGYSTQSNLYATATLREIYTGKDSGNKFETASNISLINRNGKWFVVSYNRTMSVKLESATISDEECVEHYSIDNEQIKSIKKEVATVVDESGKEQSK